VNNKPMQLVLLLSTDDAWICHFVQRTVTTFYFKLRYICHPMYITSSFSVFSIYSTTVEQPRQQDPPADNEADILWLPPLPESRIADSLNGRVVEWAPETSTEEQAASCAVEQSSSSTSPEDDASSSASAAEAQAHVTTSSPELARDDGNDFTACAVENGDNDQPVVTCTLELIRRGVKLRKTMSYDRSAPLIN
jgi:hypothetical protein